MKRFFLFLLLFLQVPNLSFAFGPLKIGTLPAGDSLILHVAAEEGFFKDNDLQVEIVPFQSALELGAAMRSGILDGHFGDIINVLIQNETGSPQRIIATTSHSSHKTRYFGLAVSPRSKATALRQLAGTETATAGATIVDYLLTQMLRSTGEPDDFLVRQEIRQIPIRLQMLSAGQIESAVLPEPLLSLVESRGAKVILDDRDLPDALAVIALRKTVTDGGNGSMIARAFRSALYEAAKAINNAPEKYRTVMIKKGLLSKDAGLYTMLRYDPPCPLGIPSEEEITRYSDWMSGSGILKQTPAYEDIVLKPSAI